MATMHIREIEVIKNYEFSSYWYAMFTWYDPNIFSIECLNGVFPFFM